MLSTTLHCGSPSVQVHETAVEMAEERRKMRMELLHDAVRPQEEMEALDAIPGWTQPAPTPDETPTEFQRVPSQTPTATLPMHPPKDRPPASTSTQMASMARRHQTQVVYSEEAEYHVVRKRTSTFVEGSPTKQGMSDFLASQNDIVFEDVGDDGESLTTADEARKETARVVEKGEASSQQGRVEMELNAGKAMANPPKPMQATTNDPQTTSFKKNDDKWQDAKSFEPQPQTQPPEATFTQPESQHRRSSIPGFFNSIWSNVTSPFRSPKKKQRTSEPVEDKKEAPAVQEAKGPADKVAPEPVDARGEGAVDKATTEPVGKEQGEKMATESTPEEELVTPADAQPVGDDEEVVKETPMEHLASLDDYPDVPLPNPLSVILDYHDLPEGGDLSMFQEQQEEVDVLGWMKACGIPIES